MSFEFRSEEFTARYHVPTYATWLGTCDMTPAYEWHRLVLQVLQRRRRTERWVLKSPVHLHSLPTLLAVFPDARLVFTHRDPLAVLGSVTSLVATMRWTHSDHVDYAGIGRYHADLYSGSLDGLVDLTECGALARTPVHHTHYDSFLRAPLDTVVAVGDAIGLPIDDSTRDAMRAYLDEHPQGAHGAHRYAFDDLYLDATDARTRFARYQAFFHVANEG
jgi:Sulfotransferase family